MNKDGRQARGRDRSNRAGQGTRPAPNAARDPGLIQDQRLVSELYGQSNVGKAWNWFFVTMQHLHLEALRQTARWAAERSEVQGHVNRISPPLPDEARWRGPTVSLVTSSSVTIDVVFGEPNDQDFRMVAATIDVDVNRGLNVRWSARDRWRTIAELPKKYPSGKAAEYKTHPIGLPGPAYALDVARDIVRHVLQDLDLHDGYGLEYSIQNRDLMANRGMRLALERREARKQINSQRR